MDSYPWLVAAPVIGLSAYCIVHMGLAVVGFGRGPYAALLVGFFIGGLASAGCASAAMSAMQCGAADLLGYGLLNLATYVALGCGYLSFVNLCIASLRIRVLEEIAESGGILSQDKLAARYDDAGIVALRMTRLTTGGHLILRDDRYFSGKRSFLLIARLFEFLRRLILGSAG